MFPRNHHHHLRLLLLWNSSEDYTLTNYDSHIHTKSKREWTLLRKDGRCDFFNGGQVSFFSAESAFVQAGQRWSDGAFSHEPFSPSRKCRHFAAAHAPRHRNRRHVHQVPYGRHHSSLFTWKCCRHRSDVRALHRAQYSPPRQFDGVSSFLYSLPLTEVDLNSPEKIFLSMFSSGSCSKVRFLYIALLSGFVQVDLELPDAKFSTICAPGLYN